jgi:phenylacetate-CoA ligase
MTSQHPSELPRDELEKSDLAKIRALQTLRLRTLLDYVATTNEFYAGRWREQGVEVDKIKSLEDFADRVPTVEKADFIADQVTEPPYGSRLRHVIDHAEPLMLFTTSGTSGQGQELHAQTMRELQGSSRPSTPICTAGRACGPAIRHC